MDCRVLPGGVEADELGLAADEMRAGDGEAANVEVGIEVGAVLTLRTQGVALG